MISHFKTTRQSIYSGAVSGAFAWMIYGVVECWFSSILPWILYPTYAYKQLHFGFTLLLICLYSVFGIILGCFCGLLLFLAAKRLPLLKKVQPKNFFSIFHSTMFILAYVINIIFNYAKFLSLSNLPEFSISLLLIIVLTLSAKSSIWLSRLRFLSNPFAVSVILLGLPWIKTEFFAFSSALLRAGASVGYLMVIFVILFVCQKVVETLRTTNPMETFPNSSAKSLLIFIPVVLITLGTSYFLIQTPFEIEEYSNVSTPDHSRTNIILVILDTVRADHLSLYGYERVTTPNLKIFSEEATLYTHAVSPSDHTLASHASIFTGLYAKQHRAHIDPPLAGHGRPLATNFQTLAEILAAKGYYNMAVVANHGYASPDFGINQGFHYYDYMRPVIFLGPARYFYLRQGIRNILTRFSSPSHFLLKYRRAEDVTSEALNLLRNKAKNGMPFFLFINYMDAHFPYVPPSPFDEYYPGKDVAFTPIDHMTMKNEVMSLRRKATERERAHLVSQYDGSIQYIDFNMAIFIKEIKKLKLYENSLIIITSDHGECFGERNLVEHPVSVYQDQVHVPLIIKYPYTREKRIEHEVVSLVDLMPTILEVSGFKTLPDGLQGESLLTPGTERSRSIFSESYAFGWQRKLHHRFSRAKRAIFSGMIKYISYSSGKQELYNLSEDQGEKRNIYKEESAVAKKLKAELDYWLSEESESDSTPVNLEKNTIDRLKSLGYVK